MGPIDAIVFRFFRDVPAGRAVVFPGDKRGRGYLVKSAADEQKISAFLKLYFCAHILILVLGYLLAYESSMQLAYALGRPANHVLRSAIVFLAIYTAVAGLPYLLFWRTFKKARLSFVLPQDEVQVVGRRPMQRQAFVIGAIVTMALLVLGAVLILLVRPRS
jgi:hypothetical protein